MDSRSSCLHGDQLVGDSEQSDPERASLQAAKSDGCGSPAGTSRSHGDEPVGVANCMDPLAFALEVELPVVLEVAIGA